MGKEKLRDIKICAEKLHVAHIISLDKAHTREKRTTEEIEKNLVNVLRNKEIWKEK